MGGLYYFKHSDLTDKIFNQIKTEICENYDEYGLIRQGGNNSCSDEPIFQLAMLLNDMKPMSFVNLREIMDVPIRFGMYGLNIVKNKIYWDLKNDFTVKSLSDDGKEYGRKFLIPHWAVLYTKTYIYNDLSTKIKCKYKGYSKFNTFFVVNFCRVYYFINLFLKKVLNKLKLIFKG